MDPQTTYKYEVEKYHVRRSVKYHDYRRRFFDNLLNVSLFLAISSGPAMIFLSTIVDSENNADKLIGYLPAICASIFAGVALVGKAGVKAALHNELKTEFIRLRQDMERRANVSDQDVAEWTAARLAIETREPPINRVIDALCHNEVTQSMGVKDKTAYVRVLVWHRFVGPFTRYFDNSLRNYQENDKKSVWVSAAPF